MSLYVQKEEGKGLSSNDFTYELKTKLESLNNYDDLGIKLAIEEVKSVTDTTYKLIDNALFSSENILDNFADIEEAKEFMVSMYNSYIIAVECSRGTFVNVYSKTIQDSSDINEVKTINVVLYAKINPTQDLKLTFNLVDADNIFTLNKEYIDISSGGVTRSLNNYIMLE